ncbi:MAG TPA: ABC transporter substrate-binding protein [Gaiellaceae bacterium]|nr:ABC transporter substrate-binding protein [Gaiellaceae bacterium]
MRTKQVLSLFMLVGGVGLLVAALAVGGAASRTLKPGSAEALKGGTLRLVEANSDLDYVDPGLAYRTDDWTMLYAVQMLLVNFPEKAGTAGSQLYPEAATAFPTVSKDGKTYTFQIRPGLKFSDGSPVTAAAFQRAWERNLSPKMGSPLGVNDDFQDVIVGADAFLQGKAQHISGITAKGLTLTFHLTKPNPTFVSYLSMQWFGAVKPSMPYSSSGLDSFPSAGPYYIASRTPGRSTVLKRNPYYKGSRPANPDQITFQPDVNQDQALLQTKAGEIDLDIGTVPPTSAADLGSQYGINKGRFFVGSTSCVSYLTLNTARPPFDNVALRKSVNYAIDRPALLRILGKYAGKRTDQILVPGIPGYQPYNIYAIAGANVPQAKQVGGSAISSAATVNVVHANTPSQTNRAQIIEYNLKQAGYNAVDVSTPATTYYETIGTKGTSYGIALAGWCADYFDPFDYINVLLDGRSIQQTNNVDVAFFNNADLNKQMDAAADLSGAARASAYAKLDKEIMQKYAPWVPYYIASNRYFVSSRVKNWIYSSYLGEPYINALSVG